MPRCPCGYAHRHVQHVCDVPPPKHGSRPAAEDVGPRCPGCNTLHAHIEHVCPNLEPARQALAQGQRSQKKDTDSSS